MTSPLSSEPKPINPLRVHAKSYSPNNSPKKHNNSPRYGHMFVSKQGSPESGKWYTLSEMSQFPDNTDSMDYITEETAKLRFQSPERDEEIFLFEADSPEFKFKASKGKHKRFSSKYKNHENRICPAKRNLFPSEFDNPHHTKSFI